MPVVPAVRVRTGTEVDAVLVEVVVVGFVRPPVGVSQRSPRAHPCPPALLGHVVPSRPQVRTAPVGWGQRSQVKGQTKVRRIVLQWKRWCRSENV